MTTSVYGGRKHFMVNNTFITKGCKAKLIK